MKGSCRYQVLGIPGDLLIFLGELKYKVPMNYLGNADREDPMPVFEMTGGWSVGDIMYDKNARAWRITVDKYQGFISRVNLWNVLHHNQVSANIEYSYATDRYQQVIT